jgi:hypothetical protein
VFLLLILACFEFNSCKKKEGCTNPKAENFDPSAERENGKCIGQRAKFLGLYQVENFCQTVGQTQYLSEIKASNINLDDILIFNVQKYKSLSGGSLYFTNPVVATIIDSKFNFDRQMPDADGFYIFEGKGTIVGNVINLSYKIQVGNNTQPSIFFCNSVLTK